MAHKTERDDIYRAFDRYLELTGDSKARLQSQGAFWTVIGRYRKLEGYGKGTMVTVLERFCDGWEAGRKDALESILEQKVPKAAYET